MDENLLYIFSWTNPITSFGSLVVLNILCWFLHHERPLCIISLILLVYYSYNLWRYRIRSEILVDPPDQEEWITISTYEMKNVAAEFIEALSKSLSILRKEHYFMWFILTSVFWIFLAKLANNFSFLTLLLLFVNSMFIFGLVGNKFQHQLDFIHQFIKSTELKSSEFEVERKSYPSLGDEISRENLQRNEKSVSDFEELASHAEPESLTMYDAKLPSHDDSSGDEFLFDADHLESSSSSASNSFELIHF